MEPRPRGSVNLPSCRFRSSQVGVADSVGTAVVALFSDLPHSTSRVAPPSESLLAGSLRQATGR